MMREETFTGKKNRFDDKNHFIQSEPGGRRFKFMVCQDFSFHLLIIIYSLARSFRCENGV